MAPIGQVLLNNCLATTSTMKRHTLDAFSIFPYFTKANAETAEEKRLQGLLLALKNGDRVVAPNGDSEDAATWFSGVLSNYLKKLSEAGFLGPSTFLVPMPRSTKTRTPPTRSDWPMFDLASHLADGKSVLGTAPVLVRSAAVQKSHMADPDKRPSVTEQADSMEVDLAAIPTGCNITLLDDVVSSGTNAMGAKLALNRAGISCQVRLLSATHTVSSTYEGSPTAAAESRVIWLEGKKDRAFRPSNEIQFSH